MYDRVSGRIRVSLVQSGQPAQISHNAVFFQFPVQQRWEKILKKNKRSRSYETWEYVDFFAKIYHEFCYISLENLTTHITFMPKTNFFLCIGDLIPSLCSRSVILILANWSPWFTSFFKSVLYIPKWMNEWMNECRGVIRISTQPRQKYKILIGRKNRFLKTFISPRHCKKALTFWIFYHKRTGGLQYHIFFIFWWKTAF